MEYSSAIPYIDIYKVCVEHFYCFFSWKKFPRNCSFDGPLLEKQHLHKSIFMNFFVQTKVTSIRTYTGHKMDINLFIYGLLFEKQHLHKFMMSRSTTEKFY